jgi:hypothetical protein
VNHVLGHRSVPIAGQNYRLHCQTQTWSLIAPVSLSIEVGCYRLAAERISFATPAGRLNFSQ